MLRKMYSAYVDGAFVPFEEAKLPVNDRGALYGDGIVATIKVENGVALHLSWHLHRLKKQCQEIGLINEVPSESIIEQLIAMQPPHPIFRLRILITGGEGFPFDLRPRSGHVVAFLEPYTIPIPERLRMGLFPHPFQMVHAHFKTMANFNRFWVAHEAKSRGFDDGITVSPEGYLLEASFGNLFWQQGHTLYIPDRRLSYYPGVTITLFLEETECDVKEVCCTLEDIPSDAAIFRTNTMGGIVPIISIEGRMFNDALPNRRINDLNYLSSH